LNSLHELKFTCFCWPLIHSLLQGPHQLLHRKAVRPICPSDPSVRSDPSDPSDPSVRSVRPSGRPTEGLGPGPMGPTASVKTNKAILKYEDAYRTYKGLSIKYKSIQIVLNQYRYMKNHIHVYKWGGVIGEGFMEYEARPWAPLRFVGWPVTAWPPPCQRGCRLACQLASELAGQRVVALASGPVGQRWQTTRWGGIATSNYNALKGMPVEIKQIAYTYTCTYICVYTMYIYIAYIHIHVIHMRTYVHNIYLQIPGRVWTANGKFKLFSGPRDVRGSAQRHAQGQGSRPSPPVPSTHCKTPT
jgi:hypothetical protein